MTESTPSWMEKVEKTAQEIASNIGCYLYDIEFIGLGKNRSLRLYIDRDAKSTAGALAPELLKSSLKEDSLEEDDAADGEGGLEVINPEVAPGESRGVSIDDCSRVSKALNEFLDDTDIIPGSAYNLEVSTPGLDRVLRKAWHFEKVVGKKIWVKVRGPLEQFGVTDSKLKNAKQVEDVLTAFDGVTLSFNLKGVEVKIPFSAVEKAKVVFVYSKGLKK